MNLKYRFYLLIVVFPIFLSGCISYSSGIIPMGPDTYTVSSNSEFGAYKAKQRALQEANRFAETQGKYMIPVSTSEGKDTDFLGDKINTYDLVFRLVDEDDPEYQRTNLRKVPDVVIEETEDVSGNITINNDNNSDLYSELVKLDDLRKKGIITDAEFEDQKKKLLNNTK